jgi:hypothetical protein
VFINASLHFSNTWRNYTTFLEIAPHSPIMKKSGRILTTLNIVTIVVMRGGVYSSVWTLRVMLRGNVSIDDKIVKSSVPTEFNNLSGIFKNKIKILFTF